MEAAPTRRAPSSEALRLAGGYRLALAQVAPTGAPGERLGRGTGSSLEFQDRRSYAAGDDVRHLDWRAFARTDQLFVRLYREEVLPRVELLVDTSASMAVHEDKAQQVVDLAALLAGAARAEGLELRVLAVGDAPRPVEVPELEREGLAFGGTRTLAELVPEVAALLRPGAVRLLVSDFLFPHDPAGLVRPLARGAGAAAFLQILGALDRDPSEGALRLVDAEGAGELDLVLEGPVLDGYRRRLRALEDGLAVEARRSGSRHASLVASTGLDDLCRDVLVPAGVLAPA